MCIPDISPGINPGIPEAPNGWQPGGPGDYLDFRDGNWNWVKPIITSPTPETNYSAPPPPPPPPPPPSPFLPSFTPLASTNFAIKQAPIDTIVFDESTIPVEMMMELLYDSISGLELANMSRTDLIDGIDVVYSPIANLADINRLFNPNNIISAPNTLNNYLGSFAVNLILRGMNIPQFDENGNLVVEINEVLDQEEINVQISSSGTIDLVEI